jgi:nucleotidyltransferase substrate binding protein (TIGR01987 family)
MDTPRWHFRFENFRDALAKLSEAVARLSRGELSELEREGTVQRFEYTWELAWKTLRDYLADNGNAVSVPSATNVIRAAFQVNLIEDGDAWIAAMKARNEMSHEYSSESFERIVVEIKDVYLPLLLSVGNKLDDERAAGN